MKRLLLLILLSVGFIFTSNVFAKNIPANAHKVGNSWTCNVNFYRNDSRTGCIKVPANSFFETQELIKTTDNKIRDIFFIRYNLIV
jgi:hypothetical protein